MLIFDRFQSVLARLMEKVDFPELIYPELLSPPPDFTFAD